LVRFFGKPRKTAAKSTTSASAEPPAKARTVKISELPPVETPTPAAKTTRKRTTTTRVRPPRRDWAAEAAATPAGAPAPAPSSLAFAEAEDAADEKAPAKRRRGTRGGRGRKRPAKPEAAAPAAVAPAEPMTLEQAVAQQAATLEAFSRDVSATLKSLQTTVVELQRSSAAASAAVTSRPRVALFVDVPNVIYAAERRGVVLDFGRVLDYFTRNRELVRASAYAPISDDPQAKLENQRFVQHFIGHPYRIVTKPLKRFADGSMKANFDIELAIDILTMSDRLDVVVLMSGDGDFRRLVELVSSRGVRVEVVAFGETASSELKTVADLYVDIGQHLEEFRVQK
jgi:uncharacterized LabA/DUF88 family protein